MPGSSYKFANGLAQVGASDSGLTIGIVGSKKVSTSLQQYGTTQEAGR